MNDDSVDDKIQKELLLHVVLHYECHTVKDCSLSTPTFIDSMAKLF